MDCLGVCCSDFSGARAWFVNCASLGAVAEARKGVYTWDYVFTNTLRAFPQYAVKASVRNGVFFSQCFAQFRAPLLKENLNNLFLG